MKQTVGLIGGGISGTLIVLNLLKHNIPLKVFWFDTNDRFCKGLAYSTTEDSHLLNVRALNMSVFADEPNHFVNWLQKVYPSYSGKDFVSRKIYGQYVMATYNHLRNANTNADIVQVSKEVVSIFVEHEKYKIEADNTYIVHKTILALGNFLPSHPRSVSVSFKRHSNYFQNAFNPSAIQSMLKSKVVTILGAGLTMIDIVLTLDHYRYKGQINVISPHGYLPQAHSNESCNGISNFLECDKVYTLRELFKLVKYELSKALKNNLNTQCVIDSMRPHLQMLWLNLSKEDKQQFLRHLRHKWGVARHRAPLSSIHILEKWIAEKRLTIIKGRIYNIDAEKNSFKISYKHSGSDDTFVTNTIINCTGPEPDFNKIDSPLVNQLIRSSIIQTHNLAYGLNADNEGKLSHSLFTIGPPLKGVLWESTAVPEIRVQAHQIASEIILD